MRKFDVSVDVGDAAGADKELAVAASVTLPDLDPGDDGWTAIFAYPGGGYNRNYFDLQLMPGYSQAEYHARAGLIFVAVDHLGVGDSEAPAIELDFGAIARTNSAAAREICRLLARGGLEPGIPPVPIRHAVAVGHSLGGFLLTLGQADDGFFNGVGFLGWSAIKIAVPWAKSSDFGQFTDDAASGPADNPRRAIYYYNDVPDEIVSRDMERSPGRVGPREAWGTAHYPGGPALRSTRSPLAAGAVAAEAARLTCPVFIGAGELDLISDIHREPSAYRSACNVTIKRVARMGHAHNFASSRAELWRGLTHWARGI